MCDAASSDILQRHFILIFNEKRITNLITCYETPSISMRLFDFRMHVEHIVTRVNLNIIIMISVEWWVRRSCLTHVSHFFWDCLGPSPPLFRSYHYHWWRVSILYLLCSNGQEWMTTAFCRLLPRNATSDKMIFNISALEQTSLYNNNIKVTIIITHLKVSLNHYGAVGLTVYTIYIQ